MNKTQIAILLVRLTAFQFVVYGLSFLTYLPERSFAANHFHSGTSADLAQMELKMMIAAFCTSLWAWLCGCSPIERRKFSWMD